MEAFDLVLDVVDGALVPREFVDPDRDGPCSCSDEIPSWECDSAGCRSVWR